MNTDKLNGIDKKVSHKEFFMGAWYQDGLRQLCSDGWPTFVVPVNMRINKMLNDIDDLEAKLEIAIKNLEFECGGRCAHQNPCNAKLALNKIKE